MVEPTETETLETLDRFIQDMNIISQECQKTPLVVQNAPYHTPVGNIDEVRAARKPRLKWTPNLD